jgi:hypothetical protein
MAKNTNSETNVMAIVSLVCGILSFVVLGPLGAIIAIVTGILAKKEIERTKQQGMGFAKAGLIIGAVNLILSLLLVLFFILFFGLLLSTV